MQKRITFLHRFKHLNWRTEHYANLAGIVNCHICRVLAEQNIAYMVREVHRTAPRAITSERPRDGSFGKQAEMVTAYFIYVKKTDFTAAVKALGVKTAE